ncbi:MAG: M23 family metallopeptidase [Pseudomonadota bacterium]
MRAAAAAFLLAAALPAGAFEMVSPVACTLGETCFIQNYVDHDPGPGARDTFCGPHSFNGHKGTAFRLRDLAQMSRGVGVLAVADGKVRATRDGMEDRLDVGASVEVAGKECGNGVVIDHEDGWSSQYCHLRRGSVMVTDGMEVKAGDFLGEVGLSGRTEYPHLHLTIRKGNRVIDPFDSTPMGAACSAGGASLWASDAGVDFLRGGILSAGLQDGLPEYDRVKAESPHLDRVLRLSPALVVWGHFFGLEAGDRLELYLIGPGNTVISQNVHRMEAPRAAEFRAVGRKRPGTGWPAGTYLGVARLLRGDEVVADMRRRAEVR